MICCRLLLMLCTSNIHRLSCFHSGTVGRWCVFALRCIVLVSLALHRGCNRCQIGLLAAPLALMSCCHRCSWWLSLSLTERNYTRRCLGSEQCDCQHLPTSHGTDLHDGALGRSLASALHRPQNRQLTSFVFAPVLQMHTFAAMSGVLCRCRSNHGT